MVKNMGHHSAGNEQHCANCLILEQEIDTLKDDLAEMKRRAYHDVLTGLSNRRSFIDSLESRVARCQRYGDNCAVLFLDVDGLKAVNDSYGHAAGDGLLIRLAQILKANIRKSDVAARIGGDEFALLLDNLDADEVVNKIASLMQLFDKAKCTYAGTPIRLGAAIGYCFVGPKDTVEALMSRADAAMYRAKDKIE